MRKGYRIRQSFDRLKLKGRFLYKNESYEVVGQTPYVNDKMIKKKGGI